MLVVSVQTIDQAISLLQRMRTGAAKPTKGFNISSATAREIKEVADCYMAVNTALVAVIWKASLRRLRKKMRQTRFINDCRLSCSA